jgi:hypothetical protein
MRQKTREFAIINLVLGYFLLLIYGCATLGTAKKDERPREEVKFYNVDLDNDQIPEIIEVYDKGLKHSDVTITISKPKKPKLAVIAVPGIFNKIETIDLNEDGYKQIALYYEDKNEKNLIIYNFKDSKLSKIFSVRNKCVIETDFSSMLARIKLGKPVTPEADCSGQYPQEWDTLVWTGEKFIKEKN